MATRRRRQQPAPVHYQITPVDPAAHLFEVVMTISAPSESGHRLTLPAWIPGSYLVRDFARNIVRIAAFAGRRPVELTQVDKQSWQAEPTRGALTVRYQVYAWDLSVRGAHLDQTHGFFNGTSTFLAVEGLQDQPCTVALRPPAGRSYASWRVATTLPRAGAREWGFGQYQASDYDELIDHPVEMGRFDSAGFNVGGCRFELVMTGAHDTDFDRLIADLKPICEAQHRLFDPRRARAPVSRYLFMTTVVGEGYGGLEHRASTALICSRPDLPFKGMTGTPAGYQQFLGLCSHEYFHTWNVKRIKPAAFVPYQLASESYTELLWVFEGFTSYYDDLMLVRSGAISPDDYLKLAAANISNVMTGSGRLSQSVANSSFNAWSKFYKQDENAANAIVSYYKKGAMVALALDLTIRARTNHRRSLDDVMRLMWQRYGRDFYDTPPEQRGGIDEAEMPALIEEATGLNLRRQIRQWAYGTEDINLAPLFRRVGVRMTLGPASKAPTWFGARLADTGSACRLAVVYSGGPAHQAGLSAGDELVAVNGQKIRNSEQLNKLLSRQQPGQVLAVAAFRGDLLRLSQLRLAAPPDNKVTLSPDESTRARMQRASNRVR